MEGVESSDDGVLDLGTDDWEDDKGGLWVGNFARLVDGTGRGGALMDSKSKKYWTKYITNLIFNYIYTIPTYILYICIS